MNPTYKKINGQPGIACTKLLVAEVGGQPLKNYSNSICGTFTYPRAKTACSILWAWGKRICGNSAHAHLGKPDSVIYRLLDGTVGIKRATYDTELPAGIDWAIGGVGLMEMYSPATEGYTGQYADVLRKTDHNVLLVMPDNTFVLALCQNMGGADVSSWAAKAGAKYGIMLDGGGLAAMNATGYSKNAGTKQGVIVQALADPEQGPERPAGKKKPVIVLDPGHGAETPGKRSPDGSLREYEFNRDIARRMAEMIPAEDFEVINTAPGDADTTLNERCRIANNAKADILVSLHANAYGNGSEWTSPSGWRIYIYSKTARAETMKLAECIQSAMTKSGSIKIGGTYKANLQMLRETNMPAVLVEHAFMTNQDDCTLLKSASFRQACAEANVAGIFSYFGYVSKQDTPQEPQNPPKTGNLYKVQVGAFSVLENAQKLKQKLEQFGYDPFIVSETK